MATSKTSTKATSTTSTIAKQWYEEEVYMDGNEMEMDRWLDEWIVELMDEWIVG